MAKSTHRGLDPQFLADLKLGILSPLRERVASDHSLCLELRDNYFNVYYRGGSLMRVSKSDHGYSTFFDPKYFASSDRPQCTIPPLAIAQPADLTEWLTSFPSLKQAMDLFLGKNPKEEREVQQLFVRDNNYGAAARSTDYYICDIEYASDHGRFDMVAVRWPSTSNDRKKQDGHRLVLAEVKYGDDALEGFAGLHAHISDVNEHLADPANVAALKVEMVEVFNQKRALGLIDCGKDLHSLSAEAPLLVLVLVNHDPGSSKLQNLLTTLPPSPHAELRIAGGSLMGYGLYEPAILTPAQAEERFRGCI